MPTGDTRIPRIDADPGRLADRVRALVGDDGERVIIGVCGAPGSGKSTLAAAIVADLGDDAVVIPMDGFHLAQEELVRLGRAERKGAIDTFDAAGYLALLRRIAAREPDVYAPRFDRTVEQAIAGAIPVPREIRYVITEGNYLLDDSTPFRVARALMRQVWFLDPSDDVRVPRLIERHIAGGRSRPEAEEWVARSDEANARRIKADRFRADAIVAFR